MLLVFETPLMCLVSRQIIDAPRSSAHPTRIVNALFEGVVTALMLWASGFPERLPPVAGKPSRGTCPRRVPRGGANRKGAGAPVGRDPNPRRRPALSGVGP